MKKCIVKGFIFLSLLLLFTSTSIGQEQTIQAQLETTAVDFNGEKVAVNIISYNGEIYMPVDTAKKAYDLDIESLQLYTSILHEYNMLGDLGEQLWNYHTSLDTALDEINQFNTNTYLNTLNQTLNDIIEQYNDKVQSSDALLLQASKKNIDVSSLKLILTDYNQAISYLKCAKNNLDELYTTDKQNDFDKYLKNCKLSDVLLDKQIQVCTDEYFEFLSLIEYYNQEPTEE